jgi:hypothetical protein
MLFWRNIAKATTHDCRSWYRSRGQAPKDGPTDTPSKISEQVGREDGEYASNDRPHGVCSGHSGS